MRLFNHYHPAECRLWFSYNLALELRPCAVPVVGAPPKWLTLERKEVGTEWEDLLGLPHDYLRDGELPAAAGWLLRHGLAPSQRFCMAVYPPEYTKSWTDCGYEYDTEYSSELVGFQPMPLAKVARQWERLLWHEAEDRAARVRERALRDEEQRRRMELALADPSALYLTSEPFHAPGDSWDWIPSGLVVRLHSSHLQSHTVLSEGRSNSGNREEAVSALLAAAAPKFPNVRPDYLRALPYNQPHVDRNAKVRP